MVFRLFIPPGEGQHTLVPKRPDPLGANATLQYAVVGSTAVAAGYTSFAANAARRLAPTSKVSRTALFLKCSGRVGPWALAIGAAVNTYYHKAFTSIVVADTLKDPAPAKLWNRTESYTVEDGCLAGAGLGLVAFLPTLLIRRASVPWWTRCLGMINAGAFAGIAASHGYFQYTGERQKALEILDAQRRRRTLDFHNIFWDKLLMARFDPIMQQYVRHNGIFRAYHLPQEVYEAPEKYGLSTTATTGSTASADSPAANEKTPAEDKYYLVALDHAKHLKAMNVEAIQKETAWCEAERITILKEADYLAYEMARRQYDFCHSDYANPEDRQTRLRALQCMNIAYNRLRAAADELDRRARIGHLWVAQKAAWESDADEMRSWLPPTTTVDPETHDPSISIAEMKKLQDQLVGEIKTFEDRVRSRTREDTEKREKWRGDLDDARIMLRAVDQVVWEWEKKVKSTDGAAVKVRKEVTPPDDVVPEKP